MMYSAEAIAYRVEALTVKYETIKCQPEAITGCTETMAG